MRPPHIAKSQFCGSVLDESLCLSLNSREIETGAFFMIGYARSDDPRMIAEQTRRLQSAGASHILAEDRRIGAALTPILDAALQGLAPGDTLAIVSLSAIGADLRDVFAVIAQVDQIGARLVVLDQDVNSHTPLSLAQAARIFGAALSAENRSVPFHETTEWAQTKVALREKQISANEAAARHGVSRATVYRYLG